MREASLPGPRFLRRRKGGIVLIDCPECSTEISEFARSCPNCGFDVWAAREKHMEDAMLARQQAITKNLKRHTLFSVLVVIAGVVWLVAHVQGGNQDTELSGTLEFIIFLGSVWLFVTLTRIWWHYR
jgi:hypothetical protein